MTSREFELVREHAKQFGEYLEPTQSEHYFCIRIDLGSLKLYVLIWMDFHGYTTACVQADLEAVSDRIVQRTLTEHEGYLSAIRAWNKMCRAKMGTKVAGEFLGLATIPTDAA